MRRFVICRRVSTKDQGESGHGLKAQSRDIELFLSTYAETPCQIAGGFIDVLSGADNDRPELKTAMEPCRRTGAAPLVSKPDRLSRKVSFIAGLLDDPKVTLRVASMPHADKFQLHIYAALAEQEREFIPLRTKAALAEAKAAGRKLGGLRDKTGKRNEAVKAVTAPTCGSWRPRLPMTRSRPPARISAPAAAGPPIPPPDVRA